MNKLKSTLLAGIFMVSGGAMAHILSNNESTDISGICGEDEICVFSVHMLLHEPNGHLYIETLKQWEDE